MKKYNLKFIISIVALLASVSSVDAKEKEVVFKKGAYKNYTSVKNIETGERLSAVYWEGKRMISQGEVCFLEYQSSDGFVETQEDSVIVKQPKIIMTKINVSCHIKAA